MENKIQVVQKSLILLNTMEEGLVYIKQQIREMKSEATIIVLRDIIKAFATIETAIAPILLELKENNIIEKMDILRKALDRIVKEYEWKQIQKALEIIQFSLEPAFKNWKEQMEEVLRPYTAS